MTELANPQLVPWESFYVIVGSSGAALVGLQFVVMALIADSRKGAPTATISAFGTPTVVHLGGALVLSCVMSAPWLSLSPLSVVLVACGLGGLGYGAAVIRRARRQTTYTPVGEDWLWHAVLPCGLYTALTVAALVLGTATRPALFTIGGAALGLLLIGIHNAWDTVTYIVAGSTGEEESTPVAAPTPSASPSASPSAEPGAQPSARPSGEPGKS